MPKIDILMLLPAKKEVNRFVTIARVNLLQDDFKQVPRTSDLSSFFSSNGKSGTRKGS